MDELTRFTRILIAALMVVGFATAVVTPRATAADTLARTTVSMPQVTVGTPVAVGGSGGGGGWAPGEAITVWLATSPGQKEWSSPRDSGAVVATAVGDGWGSWGVSFIMPERRSGSTDASGSHMHEVYIQGSRNFSLFTAVTTRTLFPTAATPAPNTRADTPQNGLIVKPWVDRSSPGGPPGRTIRLKGTGFRSWETGITVTFDPSGVNKVVASGITASDRGTWTASFRIPDRTAASSVTIAAAGDSATSVITSFNVARELRLVPARAGPGATVYMLGRGFAASAAVTVKLDDTNVTTSPASLTTNASGLFLASFTLPAGTAYGAHEVTASEAAGADTAQLTVTRAPLIQLNPRQGIPGDTVTITGSGFNGGSPVNLSFNDGTLLPDSSNVTTNQDGSFTASFTVPEQDGPGFHTVAAADGLNEAAAANFTVPELPSMTPAAVSLVKAEIAITQGLSGDTGSPVYIGGRIKRFFDVQTAADVNYPDGIGAFDAYVSYDAAGVSIKAASGVGPFATVTALRDTSGGTRTNVNAFQTGAAPQPPLETFRLYPWLTGSKDNAYTLTLNYNTITRVSGGEVGQAASASKTFRRGDANSNGGVNITDALFIAQYLVGMRDLGEASNQVNPVNAATPRNDSATTGSTITIADALFIAQMLAGIRDASYNPA